MAVDATLHLETLRRGIQQVQADLASGATTLAAVFARDDDAARFVYVVKALESVPGIGKVAARGHLAHLGVSEHAQCGDLDDDVRRQLVAISEERA